jgi:hypothetical protein
MLQLNSHRAIRLGMMVVVLLAMPLVAGSRAHAREWEPIETSFSTDNNASFRNGVLVMPNFGLAMPNIGSAANVTRPGPRMGAMLGWHLTPWFSLNGELNLSVVQFNGQNGTSSDATGFIFDYALGPLFHVGAPNLEFVIGPKLGRFNYSLSDGSYAQPVTGSSGWSYGVNVGVLVPLRTMAIGGLVTYTSHHATEICDSTCHARSSTAGDFQVVGLSFAMLY